MLPSRLWLLLCFPGALSGQGSGPQFPAGFVLEPIGSGWWVPVSMCFVDGSRLLVAEKAGRLWYVEDDVRKNQVLSLEDEILSNGDRGLLGVAADPAFDQNGFVYLLYAVDPGAGGGDTEQESFTRLVRYTTGYDAGGNLLADPGSRVTLIGASWSSGIPSLYFSHAGGQLAFMSDGSLVLSHGDGAHWDLADAGGHDPGGFGPGKFGPEQDVGAFRALDERSLAGKILRIDPATGLGLPDNPAFTGDPADPASRVWASGLRNPYRFTLVPGTGPREALFVGDVGWGDWEELDLCRGGESFGWPCHEGAPELASYQAVDPAGYCDAAQGHVTSPWLAWHQTSPGAIGFTGNCVSGACVYTGTGYPPIYRGALFFCDYGQGWMKVATLDAELDRTALLPFASNLGSPIGIEREPASGDLAYIDLATGRLLRLRYTPSNQPPTAVASATPSWGPMPLTVQLSAAGSFDPEGDTLSYAWDLGDGTTSTQPEVTHVYPDPGTFLVTLTVTDDFDHDDSAQVTVDVNNTPPVIVSVDSPADGALFEEGVPVSLACTAVDAEDDLAGRPLTVRWDVDLVHDHHVHPGWGTVTGSPASWTPEAHGEGSHLLLLELTVTDSTGLGDSRALTLYDAHAEPLPHVVTVSDETPRLGNPLLVRAHVDFAVPPGSPLATLAFDWGDGTSDVFPDSAHQVERSALHTYATIGSYTLRVIASEGARSHETATTVQVSRPAAAAAVFVPLLAERRVSWLEQVGIADGLVAALGAQHEIAVFTWDQQEELAGWMQTYLDDGLRDLVVLMDLAPARVFAGEIEGSLAERWIEGGNGLVWTGAAPFAESLGEDGSTVAWGDQAVDGLLDSYAGVCLGQGAEVLNPLARRHLPSLTATTATNALLLDRLRTKWRPRLVFARGEAKDSDAVELRHFSGGLYAQFYCVEGSGLPRAQVLAEYLRFALRDGVLPR